MKKYSFVLGVLILAVLSATGCRTIFGRGHGPIETFVLHPDANPQLSGPVFGAVREMGEPKGIELVVPPGTDRRSLVASVSLNTEATVTVISSGDRVVQRNGETANDFTAPVLYSVEVPGDEEPWQYRVIVREAETDAALARLRVSPVSGHAPAFSPESASYLVEVPFATREVAVEAQGRSRHLQGMNIGGFRVPGPSGTVTVPFEASDRRDVPIETTAEDGVTRSAYTLTLVRGEPDRDSRLRTIAVAGGTLSPGFSETRTGYVATVPFAARRIALSAIPRSEFATVSLERIVTTTSGQNGRAHLVSEGDPRSGTGAAFEFIDDRLTVGLVVTAQDGSSTRYRVEIRRAEPDRNPALAVLSVDGGGLTPAFAADRLHYTAEVPSGTRRLTISARPQSPAASVAVEAAGSDGRYVPASYSGDPASGTGSVLDFAAADRMLLAMVVTAQDGTTLRYTLDIRRAAAPVDLPVGIPAGPAPAGPGSTETPPAPVPPQPAPQPPAEDPVQPPPADGPVTAPPAGTPTISAAIRVEAKNLRLERREADDLSRRTERIGDRALITVRGYRTDRVLARQEVRIRTHQQGKSAPSVSFGWNSPAIAVQADRFLEVEVAIPTDGGRFLHYTEAFPASDGIELDVPFLLLSEDPGVLWPAVGSPVPVTASFFMIPPGQAKNADGSGPAVNAPGDQEVILELTDPATNRRLFRDTIRTQPGIRSGQSIEMDGGIMLAEGSPVAYRLETRMKNGSSWEAAGTTLVRTTRLRYEQGFRPAAIFVLERGR